MKVSIIIPVYKVEKYLKECVDSVLAQTHRDLEVILVDDGSPDNCGLICDEYALKDNRIRVIHKANGGLSDARNTGLDIASGDYISFVDSDDIIAISFIETLLSNIGDSDICFCNYIIFHDHENVKNFEIADFEMLEFPARKLLSELMTFHYPASVIACNKLYKRKLWKEVRYPFGKIHEDEFVIHQILDRCNKVKFLNVGLYYYRQRPQSIMTSLTQQNKAMLDKLDALFYRRLYFLKYNIEDGLIVLNGEILYRCLLRSVNKDNLAWKMMGVRTILFKNNLPWQSRLLLLIKKSSFPLYMFLYNLFRG